MWCLIIIAATCVRQSQATLNLRDRKYKVPVLDPLDLKEVNFIEDEQRTVGISLTLKNTKVHGLKGTTLQKANISFDKPHTHCEGKAPKVQIVGQYEMLGHILLQHINGKGDINLSLDNVYMVFDQDWNLTTRDGKKYILIEKTMATVTPANVSMRLTGLFGGNRLLGEQMNIFLNENWREVFKELSPTIFKIFTEVLTSSFNVINTEIPFDTMFPEIIPS